MENFEKLTKDIDGLDISQVMSDADLALLFIEQVCKLADLPYPLKALPVTLLVNRIWLVRPELGDKLREAAAALSNAYVFKMQTHISPSTVKQGGIHVPIGAGGLINSHNEMRPDPRNTVVQIGGVTGKEGFGGSDRRPK